MNPAITYLLGSTAVGWAAGSIHGCVVHSGRPDLILMSGLQGMVIGPYAPIIMPYIFFTGSACPVFRKR